MPLATAVILLSGPTVGSADMVCHIGGGAAGTRGAASAACPTLGGAPSIADRVERLTDDKSTGRLVTLLAPMSLLYPSSTPSWAMEWDPESREFRAVGSQPAPIFTERATTLGAGVLLIGATYQDVDFQKIDGRDIDRALVTASPPGQQPFEYRPFAPIKDIELHQR
ncbi:MAG TPA: hypothetical protein VMU14_10570, partial [Acidimicrobiales bacterium]|nr:hypothetical protein [Acidimicrobiales bacterium]